MERDENTRRLDFLREVWRLAKPYFVSEDRKAAWLLLAVVIGLNLFSVYLSVRFNFWRNDFYNTLQQYDVHGFWVQIGIFTLLAVIAIITGVYQTYLQQMLQIRWRRWLTHRYLDHWLEDKTYYRLQLISGATDNPDQRISQDIDLFTSVTLSLTVGATGFLNSVVTLFSFLGILWSLSGSLAVPLGGFGTITIPGYLFWFALVYAVGGTWVTFKIGRPLVTLNFAQQRYEADFRFSLVRLRENTESIALYGGEPRERSIFGDRFGHVVDNFWAIMRRIKIINWWTYFYTQFAIIFPYLVTAPRYLAHKIELGGLMQTADAFGQVQTSLSFLINSYTDIAQWQAVVQRLGGFEQRMQALRQEARGKQPIDVERGGGGLAVSHLDLDRPDGAALLRDVNLEAAPGEAVLVTGPTGVGKSTLLRAISGIWPYGKGVIRLAIGKLLFLPQRPYLPLGTLRQALIYPRAETDLPEARLAEAMAMVGLGGFIPRLDEDDNWAQRLSLGEQQRLSFARVLLTQPDLLFLDEATSALDEPSEAQLYRTLRSAAWHPTIVSIGHRSTLAALHDAQHDISIFRPLSEPVTTP